MNGKPLVYLDNAASTQKPRSVLDSLHQFYSTSYANIHRGVYPLAEEATDLYEASRKAVAHFLHAKDPRSVIFTRGTTESINLVAHSWGRKFLRENDEILITDLEHHANLVPWYLLGKEKKTKLISAPMAPDGTLDMNAFKRFLSPRVKLVAVTGMSNVLGTIVPLAEVISLAHGVNAHVLVDGAQLAPHQRIDVQALDCDFFAFSAHKLLGPTGVGVLYARTELLDTMDPFLGGGEMIHHVSLENITWAEIPYKFEAGTMDFANVVAFSKAIAYLEKIGWESIRHHEKELLAAGIDTLTKNGNLTLYGPLDPEKQGGVLSFNHKKIHAHDVGTILGEEGIAIRVGHHCAQPLMKALNVPSTARASFYIYNTKDDIAALAEGLKKVDRVFDL